MVGCQEGSVKQSSGKRAYGSGCLGSKIMSFPVLQPCLSFGVTYTLCWGWGNTTWIIIKQLCLTPHFQKKPFPVLPVLRAMSRAGRGSASSERWAETPRPHHRSPRQLSPTLSFGRTRRPSSAVKVDRWDVFRAAGQMLPTDARRRSWCSGTRIPAAENTPCFIMSPPSGWNAPSVRGSRRCGDDMQAGDKQVGRSLSVGSVPGTGPACATPQAPAAVPNAVTAPLPPASVHKGAEAQQGLHKGSAERCHGCFGLSAGAAL